MLFKRFYDEPLAQASFLLADTTARQAIVVDPNRDIEAYVRAAAVEKVPGVSASFTTPLGMRIDEGLGGSPADISVRIFGPGASAARRSWPCPGAGPGA